MLSAFKPNVPIGIQAWLLLNHLALAQVSAQAHRLTLGSSLSTSAPGCLIGRHQYLQLLASHRLDPLEALNLGSVCSQQLHGNSGPCNTRECFALLFGVEVIPTVEDGVRSHILPAYMWTECIIFDILSPTIEDILQVVILNPMECLIFQGRHSRGEGFTYVEALSLSDACHCEATTWVGCRVKMHCVMHTLHDARGDL